MSESLELRSVLVVDDVPINIQVLVEALRTEYRVRIAANGPKALAIAASDDPPDIILLDVMMPEMDGYEVCRRLKNAPETKNIPVIFVTAKSSSEDETLGLNLGAVDYITKPFSIPVVKARVRTHVQLKARTEMLERLAMVDGLTGIANRRSFDQSLEHEWKRTSRNALPISVVMIDIDHFKAYNDNYGHGAGDICLQQVAKALRSVTQRPADLVARYGGEEFAALLPETDVQGAEMIASAMREAVSNLKLPHEHSPIADHVTVSLGHATGFNEFEDSPRKLVDAADGALYKAKESGRNRVQAAGD
ncbi:diguanylate cyclase domain-containing protein [Desulfonatronum thiodismutans]|uniref:diguanylate cyclase domain-containing protein n=1 Tax=Desulfonatronum thiodismutans TaxID=159290 RepID=UPI0004ABDD84|nr:PleD family two-component system response regulator [Desulfonatronum thiodismutans]